MIELAERIRGLEEARDTAESAFADALLALGEKDLYDVEERLRVRWPEVNAEAAG